MTEEIQMFRQSLHGSFETFQRDQRLEEAFHLSRNEVQKKLCEEDLFCSEHCKSDADSAVKLIQETNLSPEIAEKIKNSPAFASHVCIECLRRMSFQVTILSCTKDPTLNLVYLSGVPGR